MISLYIWICLYFIGTEGKVNPGNEKELSIIFLLMLKHFLSFCPGEKFPEFRISVAGGDTRKNDRYPQVLYLLTSDLA